MLHEGGALVWVYAVILPAMIIVTAMLGHYGAKLSYWMKKKNM